MDLDSSPAARPCSTTTAFHYRPDAGIETVLAEGLRPLSALPDHPKYRQTVRDQPGRFAELWRDLGQPLLGPTYRNSGIYFTTVDFWDVTLLKSRPGPGGLRLAIPISRMDPETTILTYMRDGGRVHEYAALSALGPAADYWTAARIEASLGTDPRGWFFHVPQLIAFADVVPVHPADIEHRAESRAVD